MSEQSKRARAERRAQEQTTPEAEPVHRAIALVAEDGGYRLAKLSLPASVCEQYTSEISEPEVLGVQLALAHDALEEAARGDLDDAGAVQRPQCPTCGVAALIRHPTKPVSLCAACDGRFDAVREVV
jgi:hypothetical protein